MRGLTDEERELLAILQSPLAYEWREPTDAEVRAAVFLEIRGAIAVCPLDSSRVTLEVTAAGRLAYACDTAARSDGSLEGA